MKALGSETFGTNIIRTDEFAMLAGVMKDSGNSNEQILAKIEAIDDMLQLNRVQLIANANNRTKSGKLRRDYTLAGMIELRFDKLHDDLKEVENE